MHRNALRVYAFNFADSKILIFIQLTCEFVLWLYPGHKPNPCLRPDFYPVLFKLHRAGMAKIIHCLLLF
jgi:hypothetical protein